MVGNPVGPKVAFGENPKRVRWAENGGYPATRMDIASIAGKWLTRARSYSRKKELFGKQSMRLPDMNLSL